MKTYVTKIEAAEEGGALVSIVIESELGPIELEILGELVADSRMPDPIVHALDQVRQKLAEFGRDLQANMNRPGALKDMMQLSLPPAQTMEDVDEG